jgi:hypothetical protein
MAKKWQSEGGTSSMPQLAAKRGLLENQRRLKKKRIARRQWDMLIEKIAVWDLIYH